MPDPVLLLVTPEGGTAYACRSQLQMDVEAGFSLIESLFRFTLPSLATDRLYDGATIGINGRRLLATFPSIQQAQQYLSEAKRLVYQRTAALALNARLITASPEQLLQDFSLLYQQLLQTPTTESAPTAWPVASSELRRCDCCRSLPAQAWSGKELLCRACLAIRSAGRDEALRLSVPGYLRSLADADPESVITRPTWERFLYRAHQRGSQRSDAVETFQQLLARRQSVPHPTPWQWRAVLRGAIINSDSLLVHLSSSQDALKESRHLATTLDEAVFSTLLTSSSNRQPFIMDFFSVLGDTFALSVPLARALPLVHDILQRFEQLWIGDPATPPATLQVDMLFTPLALSLGEILRSPGVDLLAPTFLGRDSRQPHIMTLHWIGEQEVFTYTARQLGYINSIIRLIERYGFDADIIDRFAALADRRNAATIAAGLDQFNDFQRRAFLNNIWPGLSSFDSTQGARSLRGVLGLIARITRLSHQSQPYERLINTSIKGAVT